MRKSLQVLLMLLIGSALLHISLLSDVYLRYVKEGMRPLLIATGGLLILLGMVGAARDGFLFTGSGTTPENEEAHDAHADEGHEHGHDHSRVPRVAVLLYVPALMLLLLAPPALGSYTASRDSNRTSSREEGSFEALPSGTTTGLSLTQFTARALWDTKATLKGRSVRLTGFVTPGKDGAWYLSRLVVNCCAADAQVIKAEMRGVKAPATDSWATVTGVWHRTSSKAGSGEGMPALDVDSLTEVAEPRNAYWDEAPPSGDASGDDSSASAG